MEPCSSRRIVLGLALLWHALMPNARAEDTVPPPAAGSETAARRAIDPGALAFAQKIESDLVDSVGKVRRASVSVLVYREVKAGPQAGQFVLAGCGSGVLVEAKGKTWVLTNEHVVQGGQRLGIVSADGREHAVEVHDTISTYDIALLRFADKIPKGLSTVRVVARTSGSKIREGTWVLATGNPFFLGLDGASVTTLGVVSGVGRVLESRWMYVGAVQHDAEVNPGNSGGPLWNLRGDLVGLNGMIMAQPRFAGASPTNTGASFALASEQLAAYLDQLVSKGDACSGWLGIETKTFEDAKGKAAGAEVTIVDPSSPAASGGSAIQKGDVITHFGPGGGLARVYTTSDMQQALSVLCGGVRVTLKYRRGNRTLTWRGELKDAR